VHALPDLLSFECPRCAAAVEERLYGPCGDCRRSLSALGGPARDDLVAERFEPRMNVVPNHVATKD
jgi:hypothetical protein